MTSMSLGSQARRILSDASNLEGHPRIAIGSGTDRCATHGAPAAIDNLVKLMRNVALLVEILDALLGLQLSEEGVALLILRMPVTMPSI